MLKFKFKAAIFIRKLSGSISVNMCARTQNRQNFTKTLYFGGLKSFKVIDVNTPKKFVTSAVFDKKACLCLSETIFTPDEPIAKNKYF